MEEDLNVTMPWPQDHGERLAAAILTNDGEGPGAPRLAWATPEQFEALLEYSSTLPSGKRYGKRWKRRTETRLPRSGDVPERMQEIFWWMGEYVRDPDPRWVGIVWRRLLVIGA